MSIYILCQYGARTGGPEAIRQLSDALLSQGFDARLVYFDWPQIAALAAAKPNDAYHFGARECVIEDYARYQVKPSAIVPNQPGAVIVLPEPLAHLAPLFDKATVLIWWLSVDNAFNSLTKINLNHLRQSHIFHATQSEYAHAFVNALQLQWAGPLSDYTHDLSDLATPLPLKERPRLVAFHAARHKISVDLDAIISALGPNYVSVKIVNFSRQQIADTFASARLYVDLGSFPGKDRMPREAARMGCPVLAFAAGAGVETGAILAHPGYGIIALAAHIADRVNTPVPPSPLPDERAIFFNEVHALFSRLTGENPCPTSLDSVPRQLQKSPHG